MTVFVNVCNGAAVQCFDERGTGLPELEGPLDVVRDRVLRAAPVSAIFWLVSYSIRYQGVRVERWSGTEFATL